MTDIIIYDCETKTNGTFKDPHNTMPFICGVAYSYFTDKYFIFDNPEELTRALKNNICVSFNGLNFDTRLLFGNERKYNIEQPFFKIVSRETMWKEYDLFLITLASYYKCRLSYAVKKRSPGGMSLDALCQQTLNKSKIKIKMKSASIFETIEYCINDVRITRFLFESILKNGFVRSPKVGKICIPQSYRQYLSSIISNLH